VERSNFDLTVSDNVIILYVVLYVTSVPSRLRITPS
jgi:hypothetical protein